MKNALEKLITERGLNETTVLNALTDAGMISDHCVRAMDVANADCKKACQFVEEFLS